MKKGGMHWWIDVIDVMDGSTTMIGVRMWIGEGGRKDGAKGKHAYRKTDQEQATDRRRIEDGQVLVRQVLDGGVGYRRGRCTPPARPPPPVVLKSVMLTSLRHS